jgi:hypothetical protein
MDSNLAVLQEYEMAPRYCPSTSLYWYLSGGGKSYQTCCRCAADTDLADLEVSKVDANKPDEWSPSVTHVMWTGQ